MPSSITILLIVCATDDLFFHVSTEHLLVEEQLLWPLILCVLCYHQFEPCTHVLEFKMGSYIVYVRKFFLGQSWTSFTHFTYFSIHKTKKYFNHMGFWGFGVLGFWGYFWDIFGISLGYLWDIFRSFSGHFWDWDWSYNNINVGQESASCLDFKIFGRNNASVCCHSTIIKLLYGGGSRSKHLMLICPVWI